VTGILVSSIRVDVAGEVKKSPSFTAYCKARDINIEVVPAYNTHTFIARAEGAIRICKEKVRAFLRRANMNGTAVADVCTSSGTNKGILQNIK